MILPLVHFKNGFNNFIRFYSYLIDNPLHCGYNIFVQK